MRALFSRHPIALQTAFSELKRQASEQSSVLIGTPGSVSVRAVHGKRFYYRQFYDARGRKAAEYVGAVGEPAAEALAESLRSRIDVASGLLEQARLLVRHGYVRVDTRSGAILAALANRGLFRGGATLIGSHAYGTLLNELGVRAASFGTEDVDVAVDRELELAQPLDFVSALSESTLELMPVPGFGPGAPSTSYKPPGRDSLRVDLLTPTRGREVSVRELPMLKAHAAALPYLGYLLLQTLDAVVLSRASAVNVRVPRPEALAWHKMLAAERRTSTSEKRSKDLLQAAVLVAVLAEDAPDALESALRALPRSARGAVKRSAKQVLRTLESHDHERAAELLRDLS